MESKTKGILSIVFGILGLLILPIILGPLAIYFGIKARKEGIKTIGIIGIVIGSIAIISMIFLSFLGPILENSYPIAVMLSESMGHPKEDEWLSQPAFCKIDACTQEVYYLNKGISKEDLEQFPFPKGFNKGDIIVVRKSSYDNLDIGDIVLFKTTGIAVPHRIINKFQENGTNYLETKGDNNPAQIAQNTLNEKFVSEEQIIGKVSMVLPKLGWIKIWLTNIF